MKDVPGQVRMDGTVEPQHEAKPAPVEPLPIDLRRVRQFNLVNGKDVGVDEVVEYVGDTPVERVVEKRITERRKK